MTTNKIYESDIGTEIKLDAGETLVGYSVLEIHYLKPDRVTEGIWLASNVEETKARYITTTSGDLSPNGTWHVKIYVVLSGWRGFGETVEMKVYDKWA